MHRESGSIVSEGLDESPQGAVGALVPRTEVGLLYRDTHGFESTQWPRKNKVQLWGLRKQSPHSLSQWGLGHLP